MKGRGKRDAGEQADSTDSTDRTSGIGGDAGLFVALAPPPYQGTPDGGGGPPAVEQSLFSCLRTRKNSFPSFLLRLRCTPDGRGASSLARRWPNRVSVARAVRFRVGQRGNRDAKESVCRVGIDPFGAGGKNAGKYLWDGTTAKRLLDVGR